MFNDSLLEVTWAQRSRRSWTTLSSFGLQAAVISLLLLLPLWETVGLPKARVVSTPIRAGRPDIKPMGAQPHGGSRAGAQTTAVIVPFVQPGRVPKGVRGGPDNAAPQPPGGGDEGVGPIGVPGSPDGVPWSVISGPRPVLPAPPPTITREFRRSEILEGSLIRRVLPSYPYAAKLAHVQGPVVLAATISKSGAIEDLHALSGHPLLVGAAIEAVRQWRYRPFVLNREPIEVETQITVNFVLGES